MDDSPRMPFGRYRDYPLDELPDSYITWLLRTVDLRPWLRRALEQESERRAAEARGQQRQRQWQQQQRQEQQESRGAATRPGPAAGDVEDLIAAGQRTLAKRHHPDVGGDVVRMQAINAAADWLRDRIRGLLS